MNPTSYVQYPTTRRWHVFVTYTRTGEVLTRCGRTVWIPPLLGDPITTDLPVNEKACKRCVTLVLNDQEPVDVSNDPVPE